VVNKSAKFGVIPPRIGNCLELLRENNKKNHFNLKINYHENICKTKFRSFILMYGLGLWITSCQKRYKQRYRFGGHWRIPVRATPQYVTGFKSSLPLENLERTKPFQIDVDGLQVLSLRKGGYVEITWMDSCLANNGSSVSGMVDVEVSWTFFW